MTMISSGTEEGEAEGYKHMKKYKVLVTEPLPGIEDGLKMLEHIAEIEYKKKFVGKISAEDVHGVDAIIAGDSKISRETLEGADKLKIIARHGVGVDNVDLEACTEKGIIVTNVHVAEGPSVPEHVFALMLAISKKLFLRDKMVREGRWNERDQLVGKELKGKTLGIIGLGNIGSQVSKIARTAFDMNVLAYDPYISNEKAKEVGAQLVNLENLLRESDYISINCPLTDETRGMIGEKELKLMKSGAVLVNTARGGIVEEDALYRALKEGWIEGAGIDVLENEPVSKHPLFGLNNILLTPHSAAFTVESLRRAAIVACENVLKVLKGELPANVVNPKVMEKLEKT